MSNEKIRRLDFDEGRAENVNWNDQPEIFKLNDICLIYIFSFLPIPERIRIQRVCKRWQNASTLSWCDMKKLEIGDKYYGFLNKTLQCDELHLPILKQVLRLCGPCLTFIRLNNIDSLTTKKLVVLVKEMCPNLQSIDFCISLDRRTMRFIADNFDNLKQCTIRHGYTKCEDILSIFLSKNKNLQSFHMYSFKANGSCMHNLPAESMKHIEITDCNQFLPENLTKVLQNLHALETLSIKRSKKLVTNMDDILRLAPEKLNLKIFNIHSECQYTRKFVHFTNYMHKFTNLQTLELLGGDILHDETLINVGKHCKNLERAILGWSNRVRNSGLQHITRLPKLEYLELNDLSKITSKIVPHLLELRSVKCIKCYGLDTRGFRNLMVMSRNLEYLDIDGWSVFGALACRNEINKIRVTTKPLKLCIKGEIVEF